MLEVLFRAARKRGVPAEILAEGTPYTIAFLQNKNERIEWPVFVRICSNVGRIWTVPELEEIGGEFFRTPLVRSILAPARLLFTPRDLYRWALGEERGLGRHMVPCVTNTYRQLGPDRAELDIILDEGHEDCPEFFTITKGSIAGLPCALGLEPAQVTMAPIPGGVRYAITYPPLRGFIYGLRTAVTWPFTVRAAATELKAAHEEIWQRYRELEDYRINLERKVEERTAELIRARDELSGTVRELREAQEARDRLFANINHEIRTPLSLVRLAVADLRRRRIDLDEKSLRQLDSVDAATRQLLRLVDGLLVLAAGREQSLRLRFSAFDLAARARDCVATWSEAAAAHGLSIGYDGPESLVIQADESAVDRILANLVSNALKFTPSGGSVGVELVRSDAGIELAVRDTGVGIDEEFRTRIFGRFEQGRAAVHSGAHGSGVGLSIVRELARAHGGDARVESPPSGGSRFVVTLPSLPAPSALSPVRSRPDAASSAPQTPVDFGIAEQPATRAEVLEPPGACLGTILVAEDDPPLRAQIADLLRSDYRVLLASDGISALNLARKHLPDLLVSDIGMPGMDGLELTRRFRDLNGNRLAPILLLTAFGEARKRLEGFEAGAIDYILKPFEPEELKARIRSQLLLRALALRLHESEKSVSLGVLSTGLAHELRNPANGIANAIGPLRRLLPAELLREDLPAGQLFRVVEECTAQLAVVSRQLLGLRNGAELDLVEASVEDLVSRATSLSSGALEGRRLERHVGYAGPLPCAPSTILQVLANLLENAAHAAGPGGWVRLSTHQEDGRVVFEVADSGPGVPLEMRQKIFDPFFTTKRPGVGTGLGLATAKDIVLRHGGGIEVRSGSPGAVFRVDLPLHPSENRVRKRATS